MHHLAASLLNTIPHELLEDAVQRDYAAGEVIKRAGESFCHFCILSRGTAKLIYEGADSQPLIIDLYHQGDFFGEMEALNLSTEDRSLVALTACSLYQFTGEQFLSMWNSNSEFSRYILYVHCERLIRAGNDKIHSESMFLREKIFCLIQQNLNEANYFPYTKDILAEMAGISIRSLNRVLGELRDLKLISLSGGVIRLRVSP